MTFVEEPAKSVSRMHDFQRNNSSSISHPHRASVGCFGELNPNSMMYYRRSSRTPWLTAALGTLTLLTINARAEQLMVDTTVDVVADDGAMSLREAISAAQPNDEIVFHPALAGQSITLSPEAGGTLELMKSLRLIDSNQPGVSIRGDGSFRLASIHAATEVAMEGIQWVNGGGVDKGGALLVHPNAKLALTNVHLLSNSAGDGGAIYNDGGTLTVEGSVLEHNRATAASGSGGALFNGTGAKTTITHSRINENVANRAGGGIEDASGAGLGLTLIDVEMIGNNTGVAPAMPAPGNGGALHITGMGDVAITGGVVNDNVAAREGGGLWNGTGHMALQGVTVSGNQAHGAGADDGGGGIFNNGGSMSISGGVVSDNVATGASGSGGGLLSLSGAITIAESSWMRNVANRAGGAIELIDGQLDMQEVLLGGFDAADGNIAGPEGSAAPGNGGALHITGVATVVIDGGVIGGNVAAREGGGLWNQTGSTMTVRNDVLLDSNVAHGDGADDGGGAIFNNGGTLIVENVTLWNNRATGASGSGGGLFVKTGEVTIRDSMISANVANRAGGGIEIIDGSLTLNEVMLGGTTVFDANIAGPAGSASPGNGGGIHVTGVATIVIDGGDVVGNVAAREGGGLWNQVGSTMTVRNGTVISGNRAEGAGSDDGGGGIFNNGGATILEDVRVMNNDATGASGSGGGLFNGPGGTFEISDSVISANTANRAGGALEDLAGGGVMITGSQLSENTAGPDGTAAPGNGGAVHITGAGHVTIDASTVSRNHAAKEGGGLWNSGAGTLEVWRSTVCKNTSPDGGGIFNQAGDGITTITNSTISGNEATRVGGGLSAQGGEMTLLQVTIAENRAGTAGGGIHGAGGIITATNTLTVNNSAPTSENISGPGTSFQSSFAGSDAMLSPLGDFGGPTQTHLPMEGSPALNAGNNDAAQALTTDQRGFARIVDNVDLGSVEAGAVAPNDGVVSSFEDKIEAFDGVTTLREAILAANGSDEIDMIMLEEGVYSLTITGADEDMAASGDLDITRSVTITGGGDGAVIDAATLGDRVFETFGSIDVSFVNVTIRGGRASDGGGLMNRGAHVMIKESTLTNNVADGASGSGGAIFNESGMVSLDNTILSHNLANRAGGAIEDASGAGLGIVLNEVVMMHNLAGTDPATPAPGNGGAVHITGAGDIVIQGGRSIGNMAAREGGALWNGTGIMTVSDHEISDNHAFGEGADDGGGGLFNNGGTVNATNVVVQENTALGTSGSGGGILSIDGAVSLTGGEVSQNTANRAGGGMEIILGALTVSGVTVSDNIAGPEGSASPGNGGALHVSGAATVVFDKATVERNVAAREGGGLWNQSGATMTVQNGTVISLNVASGPAADDGGGGLFNNGGELIVNESTVSGNIADGASGSGGGVLNVAGGVLEMTNCEISRNRSNRAGGGIEDQSGDGLGVILIDSHLMGNNTGMPPAMAAPGNGGGLHITGPGDVTIENCTVEDNLAALEGGGLWNGGGLMTVTNSMILSNIASGPEAHDGGGGVFNLSGTVTIDESKLSANVADGMSGSGGALLTLAGTVSITSSNMAANVANRAGGGIEIIDGTLTLSDLVLGGPMAADGNIAGPEGTANPGNGGGLHVSGSAEVTIDWCEVLSNLAAREGGGLWNQAGSTMTVMHSMVNANHALGAAADDGGGGIFNNGGSMTITDTEINRNIASGASGSGGGVFNHTGGVMTLANTELMSNRANRAGGAIEDNSGAGLGLTLTQVRMDANNAGVAPATAAPGNGGALHITGPGDVTIVGGSSNRNVAAREGGGLWNGSGVMKVTSSNISHNVAYGAAADDGGGGLFNNGGTLEMMTTNIHANSAIGAAGSGGGVFSTAGDVTISDSQITSNVANRAGGGIELIDGALTLMNMHLGGHHTELGNLAGPVGSASPGNGGGLHVSGTANILVRACQVLHNVAAREGGGLWNQVGSTMTIDQGTVVSMNASEGDAVHDGGGGVFNNKGTLVIDGSAGRVRLFQNATIGFDAEGGGLQSIGGDVHLTAVDIEDNFAFQGSGVSMIDSTLTMSDVATWNDVVASGASHLSGDAMVEGLLWIGEGASLLPGALVTTDATFASASSFNVSLAAGTHSALTVHGFVDLMEPQLTVVTLDGFEPENADVFVLLDNRSNRPIGGHFAGLPEWTTFASGGREYRITYRGGDGNDVVIMPVNGVGVGAVAMGSPMLNEASGEWEHMVRVFNNGDAPAYVDRLLIQGVPEALMVTSASGSTVVGEPALPVAYQTVDRRLAPGGTLDVLVRFMGVPGVGFQPEYSANTTQEPEVAGDVEFAITEMVWLTGGDILITFRSDETMVYQVEASSNLRDWTPVSEPLIGEGAFTTWIGEPGEERGSATFYRVNRFD